VLELVTSAAAGRALHLGARLLAPAEQVRPRPSLAPVLPHLCSPPRSAVARAGEFRARRLGAEADQEAKIRGRETSL
jgi:hypothetical protein